MSKRAKRERAAIRAAGGVDEVTAKRIAAQRKYDAEAPEREKRHQMREFEEEFLEQAKALREQKVADTRKKVRGAILATAAVTGMAALGHLPVTLKPETPKIGGKRWPTKNARKQ